VKRGEKRVYGVYVGERFGITTSGARACETLRAAGRGTVRVMSWGHYRDAGAWDGPTFAACSDLFHGEPMSFDPRQEAHR